MAFQQQLQVAVVLLLAIVFTLMLSQLMFGSDDYGERPSYDRKKEEISFRSNSSFYKVLDRVLRAYEKQELMQRDLEETKDLLYSLDSKLEQLLAATRDENGLTAHNPKKRSEEERLLDEVPLYVITPTYPRMTQLSEITRLGMALKNTRNVKWLVVEDATKHNEELSKILDHIGVPYVYLQGPMPAEEKAKSKKAKGVSNRNKGVEWLLEFADENGVFYFADDDNTYDSSIFTEIRKTKKVSVFPIGFIGSYLVDSPIVKDGKVTGFHVAWTGARKYPIDMAQFAVKVKVLKDVFHKTGDVEMPYQLSYEETKFLVKMKVEPFDMEPLANNCTQILVWHTRTSKVAPTNMKIEVEKPEFKGTNMVQLRKYLDNVLYTIDRE